MAEAIDFKELDGRPYLMWEDVSVIDWKAVPTGPGDEFKVHARNIAGKARTFHEFWRCAAHDYAMKLERWLVDYNLANAKPGQRGPFG